jgi:hypothetical protein
LLTDASFDRLRSESDSAFWSTGLQRESSRYFFANGVRHIIDSADVEGSVLAALQEAIPKIQELTYHGILNNFVNILDTLMAREDSLQSTLNPSIGDFTGKTVVFNEVPKLLGFAVFCICLFFTVIC